MIIVLYLVVLFIIILYANTHTHAHTHTQIHNPSFLSTITCSDSQPGIQLNSNVRLSFYRNGTIDKSIFYRVVGTFTISGSVSTY